MTQHNRSVRRELYDIERAATAEAFALVLELVRRFGQVDLADQIEAELSRMIDEEQIVG